MSPEVLNKKLTLMAAYLNDLMPYKDISFENFMEKHYEIERLIELLVMTASDIVLHLVSAKGEPAPTSYKAAFIRAGETGIISEDLSRSLALSAGLRNILVHEYEEIDYSLVHKSIPVTIRDFTVRDFTVFIRELS